jgi:predicted ATPase
MIAAYALTFSAMVHEFCGRTGTVHTQSESVVAFSTEQGLPYWLAFAEMLHGAALVAQGQISEGKSQINQGLANYRATGATLGSSYFLALLADAYRTAGQVEEGLAVLAEALSVVDKSGERFYEAELYRLKGELLLMQAEKLKG